MENAPALTPEAGALIATQGLFFNVKLFEHAQRVAKMLSSSSMVPEHFRGDQNIGNVMIAMNYANRIDADVFMTMQSMYVVHGRPGIEAKLVIALVNQCGRFEPMQFEETPDSCVAVAKDIKTGTTLRGPKVDTTLVHAEGWDRDKPMRSGQGTIKSKWNTMRQLMFRYRAAAFFARTYCPEVLLGMQTREELEDMTVTMDRAENGSYEAPPLSELDNDTFREALEEHIGDDPDRWNRFGQFLELSAMNTKPPQTVEQLKAEIIAENSWEKVIEVFEGWEQRQVQQQPPPEAKTRLERIYACKHPGLLELIAEGVDEDWATWTPKELKELEDKSHRVTPKVDLQTEKNRLQLEQQAKGAPETPKTEPEPQPATTPAEPGDDRQGAHPTSYSGMSEREKGVWLNIDALAHSLGKRFARDGIRWPDVEAYLFETEKVGPTVPDSYLNKLADLNLLKDEAWDDAVEAIKRWVVEREVNGGTAS